MNCPIAQQRLTYLCIISIILDQSLQVQLYVVRYPLNANGVTSDAYAGPMVANTPQARPKERQTQLVVALKPRTT